MAIAVSYAVVLVCMAGLTLTRWGQRRFAALLVLAGVVLAVGVHPIADASPLMSPLAEHSRSGLALAIRSSTRAVPMVVLGLALGAGALVAAMARTRVRWRALAPGLVVVLAVLNLPALFDGGLVDPALTRDQDPPAAWQQAADALSAGDNEARVLQLPGAEFGAFRWGYTVDPPLPGMTTRPLVTRDLLPLGSPGLMDLLYALDDRIQQGTLDPAALAPVARALGVDTIWLTNDQAYDRFRTPLPTALAEWFQQVPGLGAPTSYGTPTVNVPDIPMVDEQALATGEPAALPPVMLYPVDDPQQMVRASTVTVVLVGSGDGIIDAAAAGLLDGTEAILYAADLPAAGGTAEALGTPSLVILTDTNRDRAHHWRSSQDVTGYTETGGPDPDALAVDEGDQRLPVFGPVADPADQTTAHLDGGLVVRASGYGEPFAYRPEDRPAMAVDGDPTTAWVVADHADPVGQTISVSATGGTLTLLQPQDGVANRMITAVTIHPAGAAPVDVPLGPASLVAPGQQIELPGQGEVTIEIAAVGTREGGTDSGPSAVGFAELGVGAHQEVVTLPAYPGGDLPAGTPLAVVLTRDRVDPLDRWRNDPETAIVRDVSLPSDADVAVTVTLRLDARADDATLDALTATTGAIADRRLTGDPGSRGVFATDESRDTAWTAPFGPQEGATLTIASDGRPIDTLTITQPTDEVHSTITGLRLTAGGMSQDVTVPEPDGDGVSTIRLAQPLAGPEWTVTVTGVSARTTIDRRFGEPTVLPVAIDDLRADGLARSETGTPTSGCRDDLLAVDGTPVALAITDQQAAALAAGQAVDVTPCAGERETLALAAGTHRVTTAATGVTGLQVDRVVLHDGSLPAAAAAPAVTVRRDRTSRTATVAPCPHGCWLILGEGYNAEWDATVDGQSLGAPVQISGGMNGWWLPPSDTTRVVTMEWGAQTPVSLAVVLSELAAVGCLVLALRGRRTAAAPAPFGPPAFPRFATERTTRRQAVTVAVAAVVLAALVASPLTAVPAAAVGAAVVLTRRPRLAAVIGTLGMALIAALIVLSQIRHRYAANAGWPLEWEHLHRAGLLVVVLIAASALVERLEDAPPATDPPPPPG
ncbi:MAG: alpha-(1-_3)-arabinofuranosyltransferase family protein [Ilumatobacteraceae bacterium]